MSDIRIVLPENVELILNRLAEAGYEAYVVGGCVRDSIIGSVPNDWDICTNALPEQTEELFKDYRIVETGLKHGTITVMMDDIGYEITTFRTETSYSDGRHPDKVTFVSSLEEDLSRRDFTINAMAYNTQKGLVDLFGGLEDIKNARIRCVGDPAERFKEDALRELRALRFQLTLTDKTYGKIKKNFWLTEYATWESIINDKRGIHNISKERICDELRKAFSIEHFSIDKSAIFDMANLLRRSGVFSIDDEYLKNNILNNVDLTVPSMRRNQPSKESYRLYENLYLFFRQMLDKNKCEADNLKQMLTELKFDNYTISTLVNIEKCTWAITDYFYQSNSKRILTKLLLNKFNPEIVQMVFDIQKALSESPQLVGFSDSMIAELNSILDTPNECFSIAQLAVNGSDIMNLGYSGKDVGEWLTKLVHAVITDEVPNEKEKLLTYIKEKNRK